MDESSQQAINLGVNVTIFIVALSISLTLIFGVRDLADVASRVDKSIPDGSTLLSTRDIDDRIISGYELISYYYNYIKPYYTEEVDGDVNNEYNHPNVGVIIKTTDFTFKKNIIDGDIENIETENNNVNLATFVRNIDLNANYTLNVKSHYDNTGVISGTTVIYIEQIPILNRGSINIYYSNSIKPIFKDESGKLFDNCKLNIIINDSTGEKTEYINVNEDSKNADKKFREMVANNLNTGSKYSVRIKRVNPTVDMKATTVILHIDQIS